MSPSDPVHPKVLISYSHDSPAHRRRVLEFSERLRSDGIDAEIDQYSPWPTAGWPQWMERHLREAAFVLMVCTETYQRRVTGEEEPGSGRGVCWEANLIYNDLYVRKITTSKYIPVLFKDGDHQHIPAVLQGHSHFQVETNEGYIELYRLLTKQPEVRAGDLGEIKKLPQLEPFQGRTQSGPVAEAAAEPADAILTKKLFISYPHGDPDEENLARFLHEQLTQSGHEAFIDVGMKAGCDWVQEIRRRIHWCDYLVVLLSQESMHSEMVQTEVRLARFRQTETGSPQIIPVRVRYFGPLEYKLDLSLGDLQYIRWNGSEQSGRVCQEILRAMGTEPTTQRPPQSLPTAMPESQTVSDRDRPLATRDTRPASVPGGTIRHTDAYYVSRTVDDVLTSCAAELGQTLVIKGSHQMGKSSLLLHYLSQCRKAGKEVAFVDFQVFSNDDLSSYPIFLSRFALILGHRLRLDLRAPPMIDSQFAMVNFMEDVVLRQVSGPLVIALDEPDRLFGRSFMADFFTLLRLWHNNRSALTPEWEDVDLALVIFCEPYLFIDEGDRSPFNVGLLLEMKPFSKDQCSVLNQKYGGLLSEAQVEQLWTLLRGQPYLTQLSYYRLTAPDKLSFAQLMEQADDEHGPFGDHLRALLIKLHEDHELMDAMKQVIRSGTASDQDLYYRLYGAGLVRREGERINPSNLLYARYFKKAF